MLHFQVFFFFLFLTGYIHIYQDMPDALKIIKEHKRARLKTFKNHSDAEAYARTGYIQAYGSHPISTAVTVASVQETCSNFKTLVPQELVNFRKLIEKGNIEKVRSIIWANPRYLISGGDTPAILQVNILIIISQSLLIKNFLSVKWYTSTYTHLMYIYIEIIILCNLSQFSWALDIMRCT